MTNSTAIVWFREDLRLADNPALTHALENYEQVIPLYMHSPGEAGDWRVGAASCWWLHHSLHQLNNSLMEKGSRLIVQQGRSALDLLSQMIDESSAVAVFWNRLYTPWAVERDSRIKSTLRKRGLEVRSFKSGLLFEPHEILKADDTPLKVFTPFWKRCLQAGIQRDRIAVPERLPAVDDIESLPVDALKLLPSIGWDREFYEHWQPGEAGAGLALDRFMHGAIEQYESGRNMPGQQSTSRLSPHLHFGELSPSAVVHRALELQSAASNDETFRSIERLLSEIGWREFSAYTLFHAPDSSNISLDRRFEGFPWLNDEQSLARWQQGQTGIPIIDAGMRELWHTGWMHNRVRMLVASFLTKNLMIHWLHGARWFWDTLVDADLASNTLGWQWVAGCGTDAAPYFRIFNPVLQSQKFDAQANYLRRWVPELAGLDNKQIHEPWQAGIDLDYPAPMIDLKFSRERALETFKSIKEKPRS